MKRSMMVFLTAVLLFSFGCSDDDSTSGPVTQTVSTPEFDPAGGSYNSIQHVKITCSTVDAFVYYTTDGTDPDESSILFAAGDSIEVDSTATIKARAYKDGMNPSAVAEATYVIDLPDVATPEFDPAGGSYNSIQHVKITCSTVDAFVYYTTDGTDPDESSILFAAGDSIEVDSTATIKARAYKDGMNPSAVAEATYVIDLPDVATPYFEPEPGLYDAPLDVIIHCATAEARIFYTTDGSDPDTNSTEFVFQTVIPIDATTAIRARAYKDGMDPSETAVAVYTLIPGLVAYYPFEGDAADESGNDHHGTVNGATAVTDRFGDPGAAFQFDGVDDYIELSDESAFDFTEFTISFWTRITTLPPVTGPSTPGYYCAVSKAGFNLGNYTIRLFKTGGASYCYLSYAHGTSTGNWSTGCYEIIYLNQYYHIVVTMSDEIRCYYNGAHLCTSTSMPEPIQTDGNVLIGKYDSDTDPFYFNGIIDDVRFYNRALSVSEIDDLYQAERP